MQNSSIPIKNIYYMLSYAWSDLQFQQYGNLNYEAFSNAYDLFAAIIAEGVSHLLKRGLCRRYVAHCEDLASIKGRIDLPGTIQQRLNCRQRVVCNFDELSEDNLLNQIIKATALLLLRADDVDKRIKVRLHRELFYFSGVSLIRLSDVRWNTIRYDRNNRQYRLLIGICRLVVDNQLMSDEPGKVRLQNFTDSQEMSHLYEKFILNYYHRHYAGRFDVQAGQIPWDISTEDSLIHMPIMQSDIMLSRGRRVLIIDAKYYSHAMRERYNKLSYISGNLYQIFTYTKNKYYEMERRYGDDCRVEGMLLYAKTTDEIQPDSDFIVHGSRLRIKTLDLNQPFAKIARQLDVIADEFFV